MKLVWTLPAYADRKKIREYIAQHAPAAALALDQQLSDKASLLCEHPGLGRMGRVPGTRELVAHRNYILIYDTVGEIVRILRVLHAARQWPPRHKMSEQLKGISRPHVAEPLEDGAPPFARTEKYLQDQLCKDVLGRTGEKAMFELARQAQELRLGYE